MGIKLNANNLNENTVLGSSSIRSPIKGARKKRETAATLLKNREYPKHFFIIVIILEPSSPSPIDSATSFVVARFIPDVANVRANPYTVDIRVNKPSAAAPILFDRYTLKETEIKRIPKVTAVIIIPFVINLFVRVM